MSSPSLLNAAALVFVHALKDLWLHPDFAPEYGSSTSAPVIVTESEGETVARLPVTGGLIRGTQGVTARLRGNERRYGGPVEAKSVIIATLVAAEGRRMQSKDGEIGILEGKVREAYRSFVGALLSVPSLARRVLDARGFKHYEPAELDKIAADPSVEMSFGLTALGEDAFESLSFTWDARGAFAAWDRVAGALFDALGELQQRQYHEYEAVALLNGPLIDRSAGIEIHDLGVNDDPEIVWLGYATDEILTDAADHLAYASQLLAGFETANTAIRFRFRLPVDGAVATFLERYPWAAGISARVLDVLRLVDDGDIGISVMRLRARTPYTPTIRWTWAWDFEPETAPYQSRRMVFGQINSFPLSEEAIGDVKRLVPRRLGDMKQRGLDVAFDRYRESCEKFEVTDPRRLLDIAIALEALLLNDGPEKELSYRLRLRGSRWLYSDLNERLAAFRMLQRLYKVRSQIAHGESTAAMSKSDRAHLQSVLQEAPRLLRRALAKSLRGEGPEGLSNEALRNWWLAIELGGASTTHNHPPQS